MERFNRRDWDGVLELSSADARLRVADCFAGRLADSPYFVEYERTIIPWRMGVGDVDGETVIVIQQRDTPDLAPFSLIRVAVAKNTHRADYRPHQVPVGSGDGSFGRGL